jgi:hypothetical protein
MSFSMSSRPVFFLPYEFWSAWPGAEPACHGKGVVSMNTSTICFIVFVAFISMIALLRIYRMKLPRPQMASYRSQAMCPACGAITARSEIHCQRCGKPRRAA